MKDQRFSLQKRFKSFDYAFNGLKILFKEEHNARIHLIAAVCVVIISFALRISSSEWIAVTFAIGFVLGMEGLNSAIENLADFVSPGHHEAIKKTKDLAAAAVLISAITALITGIIIFLPKLIALC